MFDEVGVDDRVKEVIVYRVVDMRILVVVNPERPVVSAQPLH